ncbi:hypothetical protein [Microbacterium sp.]|uniref:hypothetical protein n=1 Tax=Microbacterium sp. TaxID=51671 RepID=UPI002D7842DF|nr:hypothetical protein [Microbacterium sp.]HET6302629.1 hypothetical protein [Microbacterium sp.]
MAVVDHTAELQRIIESARRLGVEMDEEESIRWLAAIAADATDNALEVDLDSGTYGYRPTMLDFSPKDIARFRRIGEIVEVRGEGAESALALSGSAAQSKIQTYPGDADYFQRLNIKADTREEACAIMARLLREHVVERHQGPSFQFLEAKFGTHQVEGTVRGAPVRRGSPVSWTFAEVEAGVQVVERADAEPLELRWEEVALDPGWCKLDWVVTDPERGGLSNASNVIDVTWEAPDGSIVALDGYLDAYFQEIYLDAASVPTFAKVAQFVSADALDEYVAALEGEVRKYLTYDLNYGKAAKRMYNVFRLSGRHMDAAFVRELFDEPATTLYQVWSLIRTLDNATQEGSSIPIEQVQDQADALVLQIVETLEGDAESELVAAMLRLRRTLEGQKSGEARSAEVAAAQALVVNLVNTFYRERLMLMPTIAEYIERIQAEAAPGDEH